MSVRIIEKPKASNKHFVAVSHKGFRKLIRCGNLAECNTLKSRLELELGLEDIGFRGHRKQPEIQIIPAEPYEAWTRKDYERCLNGMLEAAKRVLDTVNYARLLRYSEDKISREKSTTTPLKKPVLLIANRCPTCKADIGENLTSKYLDYPEENFKTVCPECSASIDIDADLQFHVTLNQGYEPRKAA